VDRPSWISEAYAKKDDWSGDTGLVARNILLFFRLAAFFKKLNISYTDAILDYGGGTGLLTRLLRDVGYSVMCFDRYNAPIFVRRFHTHHLQPSKICIASEVFEHMTAPSRDLRELLSVTEIVVFTTELYRGQGDDWWYLAPDEGQHVFFYSEKALRMFASDMDAYFLNLGFFKLFVPKRAVEPNGGYKVKTFNEALKCLSAPVPQTPILSVLSNYLEHPFQFVERDHVDETALRPLRRPEPL
jgi:hypothetical protein